MRVGTWTMYQNYALEQQQSFSKINEVYTQISSGQNVQYGYQDINVQTNTLRLNDQLASLELNKTASQAGQNYGLNTDTAMNNMVQTLTAVKTQLLNASNQTNSPSSLAAIAQQLVGLKQSLMTQSNSSLNGQYLFSGSATTVQAIAADGTYQGNAGKMTATINQGTSIAYNIDGQGLFLGQDKDYARDISTNVPQFDKTALSALPPITQYIKSSSKIQDLTGNVGDGSQTYFYASGTNSSGASFKQAFSMSSTAPMSDILSKIKTMYTGNVDVSLNEHGEIEVKDLQNGSSKLDFRMVASANAVSLTQTTGGISQASTSMTVANATGIQPGDVLNIEHVGQITVSSVNLATKTVNFVGTPLAQGLPSGATTANVTKAITPTTNTTSTSTIAAGSASPQTIAVASAVGAVVGGTLALVDAAGNSTAGTITNVNGTNVTFSFSGNTPAILTTPNVKFTTPAAISQSTTLVGAAPAIGTNSITVGSTQGMSVGGSLTIGGTVGSQTLQITGINSTTGTVTLQSPPGLLYSFSSGDSVSANPSIPVYSNSTTVSGATANTTSPTTSVTLSDVSNLTVGGKMAINGVGVFNVAGIDSTTGVVTLDTLGQAGISIPNGASVSNATNGADITEFTKSGSGDRILGDVIGSNGYLDHSLFNFNAEFFRKDNGQIAKVNDRLTDVLGNLPTGITLNNTSVAFVPALSASSTITDYMTSIQNALNAQMGSGKFGVNYTGGRLQIVDNTIAPTKVGTAVSQLVNVTLNAPTGTFSPINGIMTDNVNYQKVGNQLLGNVAQVTKDGNDYATPATKLVDVAGVPNPGALNAAHPAGLEGHILNMPVTTIAGVKQMSSLNFQYNPTATVGEGLYRTIYSASQDTTASAGAAVGATTITVPAGLNVFPGSKLTIGGATSTVSATATAAGVTTLTFAPALGAVVNAGATVNITNSYDVPNAGYPGSAITSTQPNNFTYDQLLNTISMSVSGQVPSLGATAGAVVAANGTGTVSLGVGSSALTSASVGADMMLYDNNGVPYYTTVTAVNAGTGAVSFSYNTNSWSAVGFNAGNKVQTGYESAVASAKTQAPTTLDQTGKIKVTDNMSTPTLSNFAMYDSNLNSGYGSSEALYTTALATNSNNALTIDDPRVNFFGQLDEAIAAVTQGSIRPDSNSIDPRNTGIQNCIAMVDHTLNHLERAHTQIGAVSDTFQSSFDRIQTLSVNVMQVRSKYADTDLAAASVSLNQQMLSYQALMSLATKINSLSLVNYVK